MVQEAATHGKLLNMDSIAGDNLSTASVYVTKVSGVGESVSLCV